MFLFFEKVLVKFSKWIMGVVPPTSNLNFISHNKYNLFEPNMVDEIDFE